MLLSEAEFVRERAKDRIGIKSALIEYAALKRNLVVDRISASVILIKLDDGRSLPFSYMNGFRSSQVGRHLCDHKEDTRDILKSAGLNVTPSKVFSRREYSNAWECTRTWDDPVVVKPTNLSRGRGVTTGIVSEEQFRDAWNNAFNAYRRPDRARVLVERQIPGEDFRFYVVGDRTVFATHRKRASVKGDGQSTINQLIDEKNSARAQNPYLRNFLIPTQIEKLDRLKTSGLTLSYIPKLDEEVTLRGASNLSAGGESIDYTEAVHPGFREIVIRAVKAIPGMQYAGVDVIAPSITLEPTVDNYVISEVENSPAPIAHFPVVGRSRDMAGALLDYYMETHSPTRRLLPVLSRKATRISRKALARLRP